MNGYALAELERMIANLIRPAVIAQVDPVSAMATVYAAGLETDWRPWLTHRAGPDSEWWAPEPGEQVILLSPGGDLGQGWILPAGYSSSHPAPAASLDIHRRVYKDGSSVEYDRAAHHLTVRVAAGGSVSVYADQVDVHCKTALVEAAQSVRVDTPNSEFSGNVTVRKHLRFEGGLSGIAGSWSGGRAASIVGPMNIEQGTLTVTGGNVTADGIGLKTHVHGNSGPPSGG